jgi:hypothetical protein
MTQTLLAAKELHVDFRGKWAFQSFQREVQILGTNHHPALLNLHGCTCFGQKYDHNPCIMTRFN